MSYTHSFPVDFPLNNIIVVFVLFFVHVTAGKHVRVWEGSHSAVLHRSRPLLSARPASVASLTRGAARGVPHIFHHLGRSSDLLRVPSNRRCKIPLFSSTRKQKQPTVLLCLWEMRESGLYVVAFLLCCLIVAFVVAPVPDTERECAQSACFWNQGDWRIHGIQVEQTKK